MTDTLASIRSRLRAADLALAASRGGTSELAQVREATGCLLVALHELLMLWESTAAQPEARPTPRRKCTGRE
ncbi:MAG: hypothetical protein ACUVX9_12815 [Anaerolineae bacterium]